MPPPPRPIIARRCAPIPRTPSCCGRAFLSAARRGRRRRGRPARRAASCRSTRTTRIARLVHRRARRLKQKQYQAARAATSTQSVRGPITDLTATLADRLGQLRRQRCQGRGRRSIDKLPGADWYALFKDLHAGLILDPRRQQEGCRQALRAGLQKLDSTRRCASSRPMAAGCRATARKHDALKVFEAFDEAAAAPSADRRRRWTRSRPARSCRRWSTVAQAGAAEVLLRPRRGARPPRRRGSRPRLSAARALSRRRSHPLALLSLADLYEAMKKPQLAIKVYRARAGEFAAASQRRDPARRPISTRSTRTEEATRASQEADRRAIRRISKRCMALGNHRARPQEVTAECARRLHQGHRALIGQAREVELAGVLFPRHLQRARQAVAEGGSRSEEGAGAVSRSAACAELSRLFLDRSGRQSRRRHDDDPARGRAACRTTATSSTRSAGPITASAIYEEAVKHLERAVELKPEDPTINDHLGDAYWRVGRKLEARFQWAHAARPEARAGRAAEDRGQDRARHARRLRARRQPRSKTRARPATAAEPESRSGPRGADRHRGCRRCSMTGLRQGQPEPPCRGRRADGYHELESVVAFADFGDHLTLAPGGELKLVTPWAAGRGLRRYRGQPGGQGCQGVRGGRADLNLGALRSTRCFRWPPGWAAARPMPRRRCSCSHNAAMPCRSIMPTSAGGRAGHRGRRAGVPVLARLRHDRRRRAAPAAGAAEHALRAWSIRACLLPPRTCSRRWACATANCWSAQRPSLDAPAWPERASRSPIGSTFSKPWPTISKPLRCASSL